MKARTVSLLVAALFAAAPTAPAFAADLMDVYRDAQAQDPVFAASRFSYEAARETLPQARANILPLVGFSAGYSRNQIDAEGNAPKLDYNTKSYSLSLSQPLFRMQNWIAVGQAELQVQQAEAVFVDARQNLIVRTAQAYFDVLLAQDNTDLSIAQKKAFSEQLAQAKRNFEVGTATIVDTYEAQARYDLAVAKEIADQNDLEIKKRALQQLIGKTPATLATLRDKPALTTPEPADMEAWVKAAEDSSPVVAQIRATYDIAKKEVDRNRAGHLPTLDLTGSINSSTSPITDNFGNLAGTPTTRSHSIGVQLNIPIFQGGGQQSRVRQSLSNRDRAEQDLENTKRIVAQSVRTSYLGVTGGVAQVKAFEASLVSSQSSLDSTILGREVGVRTNVDILNAQQQLFQTRRDLQQSRYNTIISQLRLKAAAGRLGEEDLAEVNRLLQR